MKKGICSAARLFVMLLAFTACLLLPLGCKQTLQPTPSATLTSAATATPALVPTPSLTPATSLSQLPLQGLVIGIDPGHQAKPDYSLEPVAPGSKVMKAKVSSGTRGLVSKVYEYQVTLDVGLKLRDILKSLGATVVMTRVSNDVNISNIQRADIFNNNKTDYAIRLHCNGNANTATHGAFVLIPTKNPYLSNCKQAAQLLLDAFCKKTGENNLGITPRSDQSGFNFCNRMIINIEMGYLTNAKEEQNLISSSYQQTMAEGLAEGILRYFGKQ